MLFYGELHREQANTDLNSTLLFDCAVMFVWRCFCLLRQIWSSLSSLLKRQDENILLYLRKYQKHKQLFYKRKQKKDSDQRKEHTRKKQHTRTKTHTQKKKHTKQTRRKSTQDTRKKQHNRPKSTHTHKKKYTKQTRRKSTHENKTKHARRPLWLLLFMNARRTFYLGGIFTARINSSVHVAWSTSSVIMITIYQQFLIMHVMNCILHRNRHLADLWSANATYLVCIKANPICNFIVMHNICMAIYWHGHIYIHT